MNRKRAELLKGLLSFNDYTEQKLLEQFQKEKTLKITQKNQALGREFQCLFRKGSYVYPTEKGYIARPGRCR